MPQETSSQPVYNKSNDKDMNIELVVNDRAEAVVFHDKPFTQELSWLEYDLDTNKLDLVMSDGEMRHYSIHVNPDLTKYMQNAFQVLMVLMDDEAGQPVEGEYFPLVIHRA